MVNVGDQMKCPECETIGRVVWVSQDKKTMGVQCHASHQELSRTDLNSARPWFPQQRPKKTSFS